MTGTPVQPDAPALSADGAAGSSESTARAETLRGARNGMIGLSGAAASGLFGFLLTVVITRGFGAAGAGGFFTVIGLVTIAGALCCLGADTGLIWALPRDRATLGSVGRTLVVALVPPVTLALLVALAGSIGAWWIAPRLLTGAGADSSWLVRCASAALPVVVVMTLLLAAVRALRPIGHYVAVQFLLLPVARPILVGVVALTGASLLAGLVGWLLPVALAAVVCGLLLIRPLGVRAGLPCPGRADWRRFWAFAAPRALSAVIDSASMWVGVLLTAVLAGPSEAGVFGAVGRFVLAGQLAMQGLRVAVAPQLSRLLGAGRRADAAAVHRQSTGMVIVLSWPVYLLLAFFAPGFLRVFGADFISGSVALTVLALAMLVNVGLGNVQTLLLMSGASRRHLAVTVTGLLVTVVGGVAVIPRFGALGAACCWAGGIVAENVIAALSARRVVGQPLQSPALVRLAAVTGAVAGVVSATGVLLAGQGAGGLAFALGALTVVAVGLLAVGSVRRQLSSVLGIVRGASLPTPRRR